MKSCSSTEIESREPLQWGGLFAERTRLMKRSSVREFVRVAAQPDMISFAGGLPAPELFPIERIRQAAERAITDRGGASLQYGESEGLGELRDWIAARHSTSDLQLDRRHILIVSGAQQALDLIGRVFLEPRDRVLVENPTYLALLSAWRPWGVEFVPMADAGCGVDPDRVTALTPAEKPKLSYIVPNFQNPQGTTVTEAVRHDLVRAAQLQGLAMVEDDPYGELRYDGEAVPGLFQIDASLNQRPGAHVILTGTFSKVLAPGLRVGWVIAHEDVIDKLTQARQSADLHTSTLNQAIVLEIVRSGFLDGHVANLRSAYRERRDVMLEAMAAHFPEGVVWTRPAGGMFIMVRLPSCLDARELLVAALNEKVAFVPGEEFHMDGNGKNTLRLNFSNMPPDRIRIGIQRLANVIRAAMTRGD